MNETPEQQARDMLERLGHPRAQELTAGDVVELANLIADAVGCDLAKGKMKRFMLFVGQSFYANGGFLDFVDSFDSAQEAVDCAVSKYDPPDGMFADEWWHVVDIETQQIVAKQEGDYCGRQ